MAEFPDMKGFSLSNLKYIKQWYTFGQKEIIAKQPDSQLAFENSQQPVDQNSQQTTLKAKKSFEQQSVAQLMQIPWGHSIVIISKCKNPEEDITCISETYHKWRYEPTPSPSQEGNITSALPGGERVFLPLSGGEYISPWKGK